MISVSGKRWTQQKINKNSVEKLNQDYGLGKILSQLIISRNYDATEIYGVKNYQKITNIFKNDYNYQKASLILLNSIKTTNFTNLKNKELNEGFEESVFSKKTGKKINFFNLGFNNRWQKLLSSDIKIKINKKLNKELEELGY